MERLTYKNNLGEAYLEYGADAIWKKCEAYDVLKNAISKLAEYEDLEEQGRLIKLLCKVGDYVWILYEGLKEIESKRISSVRYGYTNDSILFVGGDLFTIWGKKWDEYIGKAIFLTKEEAEKALAEMEK